MCLWSSSLTPPNVCFSKIFFFLSYLALLDRFQWREQPTLQKKTAIRLEGKYGENEGGYEMQQRSPVGIEVFVMINDIFPLWSHNNTISLVSHLSCLSSEIAKTQINFIISNQQPTKPTKTPYSVYNEQKSCKCYS